MAIQFISASVDSLNNSCSGSMFDSLHSRNSSSICVCKSLSAKFGIFFNFSACDILLYDTLKTVRAVFSFVHALSMYL